MNAFPSPYALLGEPMVQRVGWALVHSLWQGLVVAALLAAALRVLRDRTAAARYAACCAALALFALSPLLTLALLGHRGYNAAAPMAAHSPSSERLSIAQAFP